MKYRNKYKLGLSYTKLRLSWAGKLTDFPGWVTDTMWCGLWRLYDAGCGDYVVQVAESKL